MKISKKNYFYCVPTRYNNIENVLNAVAYRTIRFI